MPEQSNSSSAPAHRWSKAGSVALFIILALTAVESARLGAARHFAQLAQFEFEAWTSAKSPVGIREFGRAGEFLSNSLRSASGNPWALERLGALDLARMRASRIPREALAAARDARAHFREALRERPASPFLWANLALSKLYLDEIDEEFFSALRHADELGPWEPNVQQMTVFAGLAAWQHLDPGLRQALSRSIERGAVRNAGKMVEIVKSYRRFDLICGIKKYDSIVGKDCKSGPDAVKPRRATKAGSAKE